jgi:hypothetical protein
MRWTEEEVQTLRRENAVPALMIRLREEFTGLCSNADEGGEKRHCQSRLPGLSKTTVRGT